MYAIIGNSYRAISQGMPLRSGETTSSDVPSEVLSAIRVEQAKFDRAYALRSTDWTQMPDAPLSAAQKSTWALYRQALRDLPSVAGFPDVPWPTPPALNGAAASGNGSVQIP